MYAISKQFSIGIYAQKLLRIVIELTAGSISSS